MYTNHSNADIQAISQLFNVCGMLEDPRCTTRNFQHEMQPIVFMACAGGLLNCNGYSEIYDFAVKNWEIAQKYVSLPDKIPAYSTFYKVLRSCVDPDELREVQEIWLQYVEKKFWSRLPKKC